MAQARIKFLHLLVLGALSLTISPLVCTAHDLLPRQVIPGAALGITLSDFERALGIRPERCTSCTKGELYAEIVGDKTTAAAPLLSALGFITDKTDFFINFYFTNGRLSTIRIGKLKADSEFSLLEKNYGKTKSTRNVKNQKYMTWVNANTQLRATKFEDRFDLILSDRHNKK